MKLHNLTTAIYLGAIIEIALSIAWFINYPDLSQCLLYVALGILLMVFGYIYEWMKVFQGQLTEQDLRLNSFDLWIRQEFKKINKQEDKS